MYISIIILIAIKILIFCVFPESSPTNVLKDYLVTSDTDAAQVGRQTFAISFGNDNFLLRFPSEKGKK